MNEITNATAGTQSGTNPYENKVHAIMDANQNYYRISYRVDQGLLKRLTYAGEEGLFGLHQGDDITYAFYMLSTLESAFKGSSPENTVYSVLFEGGAPERAETSSDYKANRVGKMSDEGRKALQLVEKILEGAGYNLYKVPGYEADDVARALVKRHSKDFSHTVLFTNDADWLVNLSDRVTVMRYKSSVGFYKPVRPDNFAQVMKEECKCEMPYNCILLYKCLVGDKSDNVKGVKGFGPKKFDQLIFDLDCKGFYDKYPILTSPKNVANILEIEKDLIVGKGDAETKMKEAYEALALVSPKDLEEGVELAAPHTNDKLHEQRMALYSRLGFNRLAKPWT